VLCLPAGVVLGEVVEADLLELGRGIEDGPIDAVQVVRLGDAIEDRIALLLGTAVVKTL
jgi:hypothetical protein